MDIEQDVEQARAAFYAGKAVAMSVDYDPSDCPFDIGPRREAWMNGLMMGWIAAHSLMSRDTPDRGCRSTGPLHSLVVG